MMLLDSRFSRSQLSNEQKAHCRELLYSTLMKYWRKSSSAHVFFGPDVSSFFCIMKFYKITVFDNIVGKFFISMEI